MAFETSDEQSSNVFKIAKRVDRVSSIAGVTEVRTPRYITLVTRHNPDWLRDNCVLFQRVDQWVSSDQGGLTLIDTRQLNRALVEIALRPLHHNIFIYYTFSTFPAGSLEAGA